MNATWKTAEIKDKPMKVYRYINEMKYICKHDKQHWN